MMITVSDLQKRLSEVKGAKIITIMAKTPVKMRKTSRLNGDSCPFQTIHKISRVNGIINHNYENSVNKQREREEKEPDFQAVSRTWGEHIPGTSFIKHNENIYLILKVERAFDTVYIDEKDRIRTKAEISEFEYQKSDSSRQGLDKEVVYRNYNLTNIRGLIMNGETHVIV